jgi:hypothetical protein
MLLTVIAGPGLRKGETISSIILMLAGSETLDLDLVKT